MSASETGQVTHDAAEIYEEYFVPALFRDWAGRVASVASIMPAQRVLDVACGTGVLAREVQARVGPTGQVVGLDVNDGCWPSRGDSRPGSTGGAAGRRRCRWQAAASMPW